MTLMLLYRRDDRIPRRGHRCMRYRPQHPQLGAEMETTPHKRSGRIWYPPRIQVRPPQTQLGGHPF